MRRKKKKVRYWDMKNATDDQILDVLKLFFLLGPTIRQLDLMTASIAVMKASILGPKKAKEAWEKKERYLRQQYGAQPKTK